MRHFTSDTHFGHANIIRYSNRPFDSVPEMNEALIANWNARVAWDDTIYHLGDVAMGPWTGDEKEGLDSWDSILTRLNGYKILVIGNHDRVFRGMATRQRERFTSHYRRWFDEVHHNLRGLWLDNGSIVDLSHFPYDGDSHDEDRYNEFRLKDTGRTLIHGHTHRTVEEDTDEARRAARISRSARGRLQIHVGVDSWDYRPVSEDEVIDLIESA
jgi:calcineurin-like phosphoesterase family protein